MFSPVIWISIVLLSLHLLIYLNWLLSCWHFDKVELCNQEVYLYSPPKSLMFLPLPQKRREELFYCPRICCRHSRAYLHLVCSMSSSISLANIQIYNGYFNIIKLGLFVSARLPLLFPVPFPLTTPVLWQKLKIFLAFLIPLLKRKTNYF